MNVPEFHADIGGGNIRAPGHRIDYIQVWKDRLEFDDMKTEMKKIYFVDSLGKRNTISPLKV